MLLPNTSDLAPISLDQEELLHDYYIACLSRSYSLSIRREVLTGKAKFGVSDDGKELFQLALAKFLHPGDYRADYYRGHTLLLALKLCTLEELYAQLYADPVQDSASAGRQMNNHHATPLVDKFGKWINHLQQVNLSSDTSTTGGQMARGLGLAFASKKYRNDQQLHAEGFSKDGQEICICHIGDASTSEGAFWETINAAGVLQVPLVISVLDDGYGISVPKDLQTTKGSISKVLEGFLPEEELPGVDIVKVKGWDYPALLQTYQRAIDRARRLHQPVLVHIDELTQPQGHSTSGSHERYKSAERLQWEKEHDCLHQFKQYLLHNELATEAQLSEAEQRAEADNRSARQKAYRAYRRPREEALKMLKSWYERLPGDGKVAELSKELDSLLKPNLDELYANARSLSLYLQGREDLPALNELRQWLHSQMVAGQELYDRQLIAEGRTSPLNVKPIAATYAAEGEQIPGYQLLNKFFDSALQRYPELYAFGEDVGKIGGVNQGFAGLQEKYGKHRVFDVGIREWTIIGQAIGMAMRGLRPIVEIQYLDYLIYAMSPLSDDLATLRWRSAGQQIAPVIVRTRGHRFEGIWHSGSPMSVLLGGLRGMHICVPRNMTQAAGMYNTLLKGQDPALVIEVLNGYRYKEPLPTNLEDFCVPLGYPEIIRSGRDVSLLTYGACIRLAIQAAEKLAEYDIEVEVIDIQTLLPFDRDHLSVESLKRTNRLLIVDEDVPGGAAGYLLQQVLEVQDGYYYLDAAPKTLTGTAHRPAYGDEGNYFSKPSVEDIMEAVHELVAQ